MNDHERKLCKCTYDKILGAQKKFIILQISQSIDGFSQNNSQGLYNS